MANVVNGMVTNYIITVLIGSIRNTINLYKMERGNDGYDPKRV